MQTAGGNTGRFSLCKSPGGFQYSVPREYPLCWWEGNSYPGGHGISAVLDGDRRGCLGETSGHPHAGVSASRNAAEYPNVEAAPGCQSKDDSEAHGIKMPPPKLPAVAHLHAVACRMARFLCIGMPWHSKSPAIQRPACCILRGCLPTEIGINATFPSLAQC